MKKVIFFAIFFLLFNLSTGTSYAEDIIDVLLNKGVITQEEAKRLKAEKDGGTLKLLSSLKFKGDIRIRHDSQWREEKKSGSADVDKYVRNRERLRLRLGLDATPLKTVKVGIRLASGSGYQNTTNQSYDGHARGKEIFIDKAYASWEPTDFFKMTAGKQKNPLFTTSLTWDSDVNPEGYTEQITIDIIDQLTFFSNFGQWFIEEYSLKATDRDPLVLVCQGGLKIKPVKGMSIELAGTYYDFQNLHIMGWDAGILSDKAEFLGYNNKHSQQMIFDHNQELLNKFRCVEANARIKVKTPLSPISVFGTFLKNEGADIKKLIAKGVDPGDSDPRKLSAYKDDDRGEGWLLGFSIGNKKKQHDWQIKYFYQELEDYAFPAVFVDSDFHGGGTNNKGHCIKAGYCITDNIQIAMTGFSTKRENEKISGKKDEDRIQADLIIKF